MERDSPFEGNRALVPSGQRLGERRYYSVYVDNDVPTTDWSSMLAVIRHSLGVDDWTNFETLTRQRVFGRMRRAFVDRPLMIRKSYFARFTESGHSGTGQIERLISVINAGNHRSSALVLSAWQFEEDLNPQRQRGFPCLNAIYITVRGNCLSLRGMYPLQYAIPKLYGNLLGIRALGLHIAKNTNTLLTEFSCYAGVERIGANFTKAELRDLLRYES